MRILLDYIFKKNMTKTCVDKTAYIIRLYIKIQHVKIVFSTQVLYFLPSKTLKMLFKCEKQTP